MTKPDFSFQSSANIHYICNTKELTMIMKNIYCALLAVMFTAAAGAQSLRVPASAIPVAEAGDSTVIIVSPEVPAPDDIYNDESIVIEGDVSTTLAAETPEWLRSENLNSTLVRLGDTSHDVSIAEFAVPAGVFAAAALFVRTPPLVKARKYVQKHLSQHGDHKTAVDDYLQYLPMVAPYGLYLCGMKGQHSLLDRTKMLAMSYATFAVLNNSLKFAFGEKRPDSSAHNSFPSGHTGTVVTGAEFLRREYWDSNKWVAMSGYVVALGVGYLRIHNDRHWINDVVGGAALGYLSTTFAYWIYPKIFRKRTRMHRDELLEQNSLALPQSNQSRQISWMASPAIGNGAYGISASLTF